MAVMIDEIKKLRLQIDGLAKLTKELKPLNIFPTNSLPYCINSKEIEKAVDSLYLAKAWLGEILIEPKEPTPYFNEGNRKTIEDIEPEQDVDDTLNWIDKETWLDISTKKGTSHIERVDWLITEIKKLINELNKLKPLLVAESRLVSCQLLNIEISYGHLCEAKFNLRFELQRIKNDNNK